MSTQRLGKYDTYQDKWSEFDIPASKIDAVVDNTLYQIRLLKHPASHFLLVVSTQ